MPGTMTIVLMGVSGAGKTEIGTSLGRDLQWTFYDGDDYHPKANKEKMASGTPLTDEDRWPWLQRLGELIAHSQEPVIVGCSALKESYREVLRVNDKVVFVHLKGDYETIKQRMEARGAHFFKPAMLKSQFATLEPPSNAISVDITKPVAEIVKQIRQELSIEVQGHKDQTCIGG